MKKTKVSTGPKPVRSDNITMRFDPRLKYMTSVAGRHLRQSLSTVVEVAISKYLETVIIRTGGEAASIADLTTRLWSPFEATRFVLLADRFPFLLSTKKRCYGVLFSGIGRCGALCQGVRKSAAMEMLSMVSSTKSYVRSGHLSSRRQKTSHRVNQRSRSGECHPCQQYLIVVSPRLLLKRTRRQRKAKSNE